MNLTHLTFVNGKSHEQEQPGYSVVRYFDCDKRLFGAYIEFVIAQSALRRLATDERLMCHPPPTVEDLQALEVQYVLDCERSFPLNHVVSVDDLGSEIKRELWREHEMAKDMFVKESCSRHVKSLQESYGSAEYFLDVHAEKFYRLAVKHSDASVAKAMAVDSDKYSLVRNDESFWNLMFGCTHDKLLKAADNNFLPGTIYGWYQTIDVVKQNQILTESEQQNFESLLCRAVYNAKEKVSGQFEEYKHAAGFARIAYHGTEHLFAVPESVQEVVWELAEAEHAVLYANDDDFWQHLQLANFAEEYDALAWENGIGYNLVDGWLSSPTTQER